MSSLKNKLIKLAYEKPHLRKGLLPLIIKKYATLNAQVFDAIASTLCKSAGMVDEDNNIIIKEKQKIQTDLTEMFDSAIKSINQENLESFVPLKSINVESKKDMDSTAFVYKKMTTHTDYVLSGAQEDAGYSKITYDIPNRFAGTLQVIINLAPYDEKITNLYKKVQEKKDTLGNPLLDEDGQPIKIEAKSSPTLLQRRDRYISLIKVGDQNWVDSIINDVESKLNEKSNYFITLIEDKLNGPDGKAGIWIPSTVENKMDPKVTVNESSFNLSIKKDNKDILDISGALTFQVTFGGSLQWGALLTDTNTIVSSKPTPETVNTQVVSENTDEPITPTVAPKPPAPKPPAPKPPAPKPPAPKPPAPKPPSGPVPTI